MKTNTALTAVVLTIGLSTACGERALRPEPVALDRAECARCSMLISSDATGAQIVSRDGPTRFYDDIGCLAADATHIGRASRAFVRVADGWIDVNEASFARPAGAHTPMGSGILAFRSADAARAADAHGRALAWADVGPADEQRADAGGIR
jgi:hypothetical protein